MIQATKESDTIGFDVVYDISGKGLDILDENCYRITIDEYGLYAAQGDDGRWVWATKTWSPLDYDVDYASYNSFIQTFREHEEHVNKALEFDMRWLNKYEPEYIGFAMSAKINDEQWYFPVTEKIRQLPDSQQITDRLENPSLWGKMKFANTRFDNLVTLTT